MFTQKENVYLRVLRLILSLSKLKQKKIERENEILSRPILVHLFYNVILASENHISAGNISLEAQYNMINRWREMSDDGTNGRINICLASARRKSIKNCVARHTPYVCKSEVGTTARLGFTSRVHRINLLY